MTNLIQNLQNLLNNLTKKKSFEFKNFANEHITDANLKPFLEDWSEELTDCLGICLHSSTAKPKRPTSSRKE